MELEIWAYRSDGHGCRPTRRRLRRRGDGRSIGKIDEATQDVGACYVVVDTGPWILGKKVLLPAGLLTAVDREREVVFVGSSKEEIKSAPPFDPEAYKDEGYRAAVASYYLHEAAREGDRLRKTG